MAESGINTLAPRLLELYLEVLKEDDPILRSLSLQGLSHFVGVRMDRQESERVHQALLSLLQQPNTADSVIEEINRFFCKYAEHKGDWFTELVVLKLLDMAVSGKLP